MAVPQNSTGLPPLQGNSLAARSWYHTQTKVINVSYEWTIDNFSFRYEETGDVLKSSIFSSADANNTSKWCLLVYPRGSMKISRDHLSIQLRLVSSDEFETWADVKLSILNFYDQKSNITWKTEKPYRFMAGNTYGNHSFIHRDNLLNSDLLPGNKLTILCELKIVVDSVNTSGQLKISESRLSDDLSQLLDEQNASDVVSIVAGDGQELQAHKAILTARSQVFAAMFQHQMEEHKHNRVTISDIDYEVLKEMLRFINSDKVTNLETMAEGLLVAANKYALERLKEMCEEALCADLSVENVAHFLTLADLHSAEQLKAWAINFIKK